MSPAKKQQVVGVRDPKGMTPDRPRTLSGLITDALHDYSRALCHAIAHAQETDRHTAGLGCVGGESPEYYWHETSMVRAAEVIEGAVRAYPLDALPVPGRDGGDVPAIIAVIEQRIREQRYNYVVLSAPTAMELLAILRKGIDHAR